MPQDKNNNLVLTRVDPRSGVRMCTTLYACDKDLNSLKPSLQLFIYYYCRYLSFIYY